MIREMLLLAIGSCGWLAAGAFLVATRHRDVPAPASSERDGGLERAPHRPFEQVGRTRVADRAGVDA